MVGRPSKSTDDFPGEEPVPFIDLVGQYNAIAPEIQEAVTRVFAEQKFILGEEVAEFEHELADYCDAREAIGCASGTDALILSLLACDVGPGDEVITTPFTFQATAGAIVTVGATPVFVDINPDDFNINVDSVEAAITDRTKALMPVHLFGQCAEMEPLCRIAAQYGLSIVEDACQAIGGEYQGRRAGVLGNLGCFSFYPTKNLNGAGDGGMITTDHPELAARLRRLRVHGDIGGYMHGEVGMNSRLDAIQAAVLRVKLRSLEIWTESRRENASRYNTLIEEYGLNDAVRSPVVLPDRRHVYNQYCIRVKQGLRDEVLSDLRSWNIGAAIYYPRALHLQDCFRNLGYQPGDFPERDVIRGRYKRLFRKKVVANVVAFSSVVANGEYGKALRIGAGSWWDYRTMVWNRGLDLWQLEKKQIGNITDKSSLFLDTFWKLTRKRRIPDRWLIRSGDLDRLDAAIQQADPSVRLRVLKRMRPFMECYPPYWYYVARTQQQLGRLDEAAETYKTLESIGAGHFRNDELLAAGTANLAAIQDYRRRKNAEKTARRALSYSADAWEVNLLCAGVLHRHAKNTDAEDALLRNLDVQLETEQSLSALLMLYCETKKVRKLRERLETKGVIQSAPAPALCRCLTFLNSAAAESDDGGATHRKLREKIGRQLRESLSVHTDRHFGPDDLCVVATPQWQLPAARIAVVVGEQQLEKYQVEQKDDRHEARFRGVLNLGSLINPVALSGPLTVHVTYANGIHVTATMERRKTVAAPGIADTYRIAAMTVGTARVAASSETAQAAPIRQETRPAVPAVRRSPLPVPVKSQPRSKSTRANMGPDLIPPPPKRRPEIPARLGD
eukprot:g26585.t1